jgi:Fe-S cluster biogenesis protein NfuA
MREKIEAAIDRVRPALQADGGDVELIEVNDGVVSVRLTGACGGCPMATLRRLPHGNDDPKERNRAHYQGRRA